MEGEDDDPKEDEEEEIKEEKGEQKERVQSNPASLCIQQIAIFAMFAMLKNSHNHITSGSQNQVGFPESVEAKQFKCNQFDPDLQLKNFFSPFLPPNFRSSLFRLWKSLPSNCRLPRRPMLSAFAAARTDCTCGSK